MDAKTRLIPEHLETPFNHTDQALMQNPYPLYEQMRGKCPVNHTQALGGFWTVANYDDLKAVEFDWATYSNADGTGIPKHALSPMYPQDIDPPLQTEYRKLLNPHFTAAGVSKWADKVREVTHQMIDNIIEKGEADLASEVCRPMPPKIALPFLGVPPADEAQICHWIEHLTTARASDPVGVGETVGKITQYLLNLVAQRRTAPAQDDVLGDLLTAKINGQALTDDDIFRVIIILLFGSLDTTTAAMLESLRHLANHPEDKARLTQHPEMWPVALQEFVRYASPVQGLRRTLTKDATLHGVDLQAGDKLLLLFGSANRDESKFTNGNKCIIDRAPNNHVAFGAGPHICLGRHMALLQLETLLRAVLERIPDFTLAVPDSEIRYASAETRGILSLPVRFTPGQRRKA